MLGRHKKITTLEEGYRELLKAVRKLPRSPPRTPAVHDYTQRYWGHDYTWDPDPGSEGVTGSAMGWGHDIQDGDVLLLKGPSGGPSPYLVESIEYFPDPRDMWKARLRYSPKSWQKLSPDRGGM